MDFMRSRLQSITPREAETLRHIVYGKTDVEVAIEMGVTVHTANAYRKSLLRKLNANNVASLVRIALWEGYVKPSD